MMHAAMYAAYATQIARLNDGLDTVTMDDVWRELDRLLHTLDFAEIDDHILFLDFQMEYFFQKGDLYRSADRAEAKIFYGRLRDLVQEWIDNAC